jgi:hypothetical protein
MGAIGTRGVVGEDRREYEVNLVYVRYFGVRILAVYDKLHGCVLASLVLGAFYSISCIIVQSTVETGGTGLEQDSYTMQLVQ